MKIVFLGTNGWYTNQTGNSPCILIDSREGYIILDAGNGIYKIDDYIKEKKPIFLFISHFHLDHVSGVHTFPKFEFKQGIDVYVGYGRKKDFETLVNPPFTIGFNPSPKKYFRIQLWQKMITHSICDHSYSAKFHGRF